MAVDPRRFDQIERVVRDDRKNLEDLRGTVMSRLASHTHDYVQSVNGETGAVVLDAADVGAATTQHVHEQVAGFGRGSSSVTIPNVTWTTIPWTEVDSVGSGLGWLFSGSGSIWVPYDAWYLFTASVYIQGGTGGTAKAARWVLDGSVVNWSQANTGSGADQTAFPAPTTMFVTTSQPVTLQAWQNTGGNRSNLTNQTSVSVVMVGVL